MPKAIWRHPSVPTTIVAGRKVAPDIGLDNSAAADEFTVKRALMRAPP